VKVENVGNRSDNPSILFGNLGEENIKYKMKRKSKKLISMKCAAMLYEEEERRNIFVALSLKAAEEERKKRK
jgi:hypothetical protein